jgi:hypothetical protein
MESNGVFAVAFRVLWGKDKVCFLDFQGLFLI